MKLYRIGIATAATLLTLISGHSYAQLRKASDYFPLQIGNIWEYQHYLGFSKPQHFEIISDTLIADTVRVYRTLLKIIDPGNPSPQEGYVYYHYNSDSTVVYRDYDFPTKPYCGLPMIDTRGGIGSIWKYPIGDYLGAFAITDTGKAFYFQRIRNWAEVKSGVFVREDSVKFDGTYHWFFFENIGFTRDGIDTLLYAKINGVEYGTSLNVKQKKEIPDIPRDPSLQVYPNPFSDQTVIEIETFYLQRVEISVFNLLSQRVRLLQSESLSIDRHFLTWDGYDDKGKKLNKGIYFLVLRSQQNIKTVKILHL